MRISDWSSDVCSSDLGLDGKAAVQDAPDPVGDTVDQADGAVQKSVDAANLTLATREQVRAGAELYGTDGQSVGTVQSVEGDPAVAVRGGQLYNVPLAEIYTGAVESEERRLGR